jgi:glycerol-3-phosphate dehydrogenase
MEAFDLLVIGGGINGAAIARDAAGRGLKVLLVEKDDLASHTSSASSKLIHGGLRYLEQRAFRLVRESLHEREVLLETAPHIVRPLRFVMPAAPGGRPWWILRVGLFLYGVLAGKSRLPRPGPAGADEIALGAPLKGKPRLATYWDAWVDDSRLTILNAVDAAEHSAEIATRTELLTARREGSEWAAQLSGGRNVRAAMIVNAAGPWVAQVLGRRLGSASESGVRLVRGIHVAVPRLYEGDHAYILQNRDGRVVFALPYGALTLVGTTDSQVAAPEDARVETDEVAYLCAAVNAYFVRQAAPQDVRWSYAGVRALYDDGAASAKDVTRDYHLELDEGGGPKLLSVFGGKLTTARALAEEALDKLGVKQPRWTAGAPLPGGDLSPEFDEWLAGIAAWLPAATSARLRTAYGTRLTRMLNNAASAADLGRDFGGGLSEAELRYLAAEEFARTAEDVLWRRSKLGLVLDGQEQRAVADFMASARAA